MQQINKKTETKLNLTTMDFSTTSSFIEKPKMLIDLSIQENERQSKWKFHSLASSKIEGFKISESNKNVLNAIFAYFHGNTDTLSQNKGIYMFGDFGCGKTTLFSIFSKYLAANFPFSDFGFGNVSIEQVAEEYKKSNSTSKFVTSELTGNPNRLCFHEIGKTIDEKYYGTSINQIINSLMMRRYENFQRFGTITHVTSNFHPSNLTCFDAAMMDRLKEMFNFVEWKGDSLRK